MNELDRNFYRDLCEKLIIMMVSQMICKPNELVFTIEENAYINKIISEQFKDEV